MWHTNFRKMQAADAPLSCHYGWCWEGRHRGKLYLHVFAEIESVEVLNWFKCSGDSGEAPPKELM